MGIQGSCEEVKLEYRVGEKKRMAWEFVMGLIGNEGLRNDKDFKEIYEKLDEKDISRFLFELNQKYENIKRDEQTKNWEKADWDNFWGKTATEFKKRDWSIVKTNFGI